MFSTCPLANVYAADNSHRAAAEELLLLTNQNNLMQETIAITQKNMEGMMAKIQKISEEMAEEIRAHGEKPPE